MRRGVLPLIGLLLAAGCDNREPPASDRGSIEIAAVEEEKLPRGVTMDGKGLWSLASAPALTPRTLSAKASMRSATSGRHLHLFHERPPSAQELAETRSRVVTSDLVRRVFSGRLTIVRGCLRLDTPGHPLVRFVAAPLIQRDAAGYLVLGGHDAQGRADYSRIGEPVIWEGGPYRNTPGGPVPAPVTDPAALAPIHAACGPGPVVALPPHLASASIGREAQYEGAVQQHREMYGVGEAEARRRFAACRANQTCAVSPPPPAADPRMCPPETRWQSGLCRTAEGFVRPLP